MMPLLVRDIVHAFAWAEVPKFEVLQDDFIWKATCTNCNIIQDFIEIAEKLVRFLQSWFPGSFDSTLDVYGMNLNNFEKIYIENIYFSGR